MKRVMREGEEVGGGEEREDVQAFSWRKEGAAVLKVRGAC